VAQEKNKKNSPVANIIFIIDLPVFISVTPYQYLPLPGSRRKTMSRESCEYFYMKVTLAAIFPAREASKQLYCFGSNVER
jgi:hypothetical protein